MRIHYMLAIPGLLSLAGIATAGNVELQQGMSLESELETAAQRDFTMPMERGGYAELEVMQHDLDVVVTVLDPSGEEVTKVDSPIGSNGPEEVTFEADNSGRYVVRVSLYDPSTPERADGRFQVTVKKVLSKDANDRRLARLAAERQRAVEYVREHAVPLDGVKAGQGFVDMAAIASMVGDARVVALGEATHGSREFFQLKHRMLEYLVEKHGFNVFAIEASMPAAADVNSYILTGKGDPAKALAGLHFWTWDTEEVLAMIEWMRAYNADPSHSRKLKFYGFDMQYGARAWQEVDRYLGLVDAKAQRRFREQPGLSDLADPYTERLLRKQDAATKASALEAARRTLTTFDENRASYSGASGAEAWRLARQYARILTQVLEYYQPGSRLGTRDRFMAENLEWILKHEGAGARVVAWAHNAHVSNRNDFGYPRMGYVLRASLEDDLRIFGMLFNQGSFQAIEFPPSTGSGLRNFHVDPMPGTVEHLLSEAGPSLLALDLAPIRAGAAGTDWFRRERLTRNWGGAAGGGINPRVNLEVAAAYDALLFFEETTAANPMPSGLRTRFPVNPEPRNLDFEQRSQGELPVGWHTMDRKLQAYGYVVTNDRQGRSGNRALRISRNVDTPANSTFGWVTQQIDASTYRGKRLRVRVAVRTEFQTDESAAYIDLRADGQQRQPAEEDRFTQTTADSPIRSDDWEVIELDGVVPEDARRLTIRLVMSGEGSAWFDDISVETVEL